MNEKIQIHKPQVQRVLLPGSWQVRAELYKLNVYPEGGHFMAHVDTPRSPKEGSEGEGGPTMCGSLVVCLPSVHEGGELVVRHNGQAIIFSWGPASANAIQWAAFFSDCEHEILPVRSGFRITLTYNLFVYKRKPYDFSAPPTKAELPLEYGKRIMRTQPAVTLPDGDIMLCLRSDEHPREKQLRKAKKKQEGEKRSLIHTEDIPAIPSSYSRNGQISMLTDRLFAVLAEPYAFNGESITLVFTCQHAYTSESLQRSPSVGQFLKGLCSLCFLAC